MNVLLRVFTDAAEVEVDNAGQRHNIGWFRDEISALTAAAEWALMRSAVLSELRRLPELVICSQYVAAESGKKPRKYTRATRNQLGPNGRKVVRLPGSADKFWVRGAA